MARAEVKGARRVRECLLALEQQVARLSEDPTEMSCLRNLNSCD